MFKFAFLPTKKIWEAVHNNDWGSLKSTMYALPNIIILHLSAVAKVTLVGRYALSVHG